MRGSRRGRQALFASLVAAAVALGGIPSAGAVPSRDLNQVRAQVRDLQAKAETATENYNEARIRLSDVQGRLDKAKQRVAKERRQLRAVTLEINSLARATYTNGGVDPSLQVLLADDPAEFLAQAAALDQVEQAQAASLRESQTARLRLAQAEAAVQQEEQNAQDVRDEMAAAKKEADSNLADAQAVLDSLEAKERERLAQLAASERQAAMQAANQASAALSGGGGYTGGSRAAAAVQYALSQVGDRYVAAQAGPDSFDCSGLTLAAWRQGGVSLPHYSYSQYQATERIPLSEAQPGDLVFYFGGSVHHVGLYIGNGKMVHAANPGDGVIVTDVLAPWYRTYFTGVGRVLG